MKALLTIAFFLLASVSVGQPAGVNLGADFNLTPRDYGVTVSAVNNSTGSLTIEARKDNSAGDLIEEWTIASGASETRLVVTPDDGFYMFVANFEADGPAVHTAGIDVFNDFEREPTQEMLLVATAVEISGIENLVIQAGQIFNDRPGTSDELTAVLVQSFLEHARAQESFGPAMRASLHDMRNGKPDIFTQGARPVIPLNRRKEFIEDIYTAARDVISDRQAEIQNLMAGTPSSLPASFNATMR